MTWLVAVSWIRAHWGAVAVVALCAVLVRACHARDLANVEIGRQQVVVRQRDSSVAALQREAKALGDTVSILEAQLSDAHADYEQQIGLLGRSLGRDTVAIERWIRDTVRLAADTVRFAVPASAILAADSALAVCREIQNTCTQFRATAQRRFAADSMTIQVLRHASLSTLPRHACGLQATLGPALVYQHGFDGRLGAVVGWGCHW